MAETQDKDQRTEEATPRRREEAREKGQVALSAEMTAAIGLVAGLGALLVGGGRLVGTLGDLVVETVGEMSPIGRTELSVPQAAGILRHSLESVVPSLAMVVLPAIACVALAAFVQVGFRIAPEAVEPDPSKIDPVKGMGRLFGMRSLMRTGLAGLKVLAISVVVAVIAWKHVPDVVRLGSGELGPLLLGLGHIALSCTTGALVTILLLGLIDLVFQRYQHEKDLRMTKQEVKDENRLTEGDPHVRARVRQLQREMATRRMMADVPKATVVVTNPTHFAVALKYERDESGRSTQRAPVVVAKGADHLAKRIREVATEAKVQLFEDPPLARALYAKVDVGREIPEELYTAVATVLGHVYRLQEGLVRAG